MGGSIIMYQFIQLNRQGNVAVLTLNRPERYNAWHSPMRDEIVRALDDLNADDAVRTVIMTGAGDKAFSAGQDLAESQTFDGDRAEAWILEWKRMYGALRGLDKPIVAALNGVAAGSAFQVALLCDVRVGHPGVRMGQPEINSGIPSTLGPWLMWETLGWSRTVELWLTGRLMDGEECYRVGIIHHLVPQDQVMAKAIAVATELAAKPPVAMRLNKARLRKITEAGFIDAEEAGREIQRTAYATGEPQSMMAKFFAERAARKASGAH
jgi:enoyl-CoA hydratase/carnithine racemase